MSSVHGAPMKLTSPQDKLTSIFKNRKKKYMYLLEDDLSIIEKVLPIILHSFFEAFHIVHTNSFAGFDRVNEQV